MNDTRDVVERLRDGAPDLPNRLREHAAFRPDLPEPVRKILREAADALELQDRLRSPGAQRAASPSPPDEAMAELDTAMKNTTAWKLGTIYEAIARLPAGDPIDRGLQLCRLLNEGGFQLLQGTGK